MPITADSEWRLTGDTDLSSFTKALSRSFMAGSSPVVAEAGAVYEALRGHGLTRLGAAFLWHESKNGSWHCGSAPAGSPCIPKSNRNPFAMKNPGGGWAVFDSYEDAAETWVDRLLSPNGPYRNAGTIGELIDVYAPGFENDVAKYRDVIVREINALPEVTAGAPQPAANPWPKPTLYSLDRDFARFGLTKWQADKILSHRFSDRGGVGIRALVLHIQEGTSASSLGWWASGNADASSNVMVQKDGSLLRIIPDLPGAPWTNGDTQRPSAKGRALIDAIGGGNPNLASLTIEAEGYTGDDMPEAQARSICWMLTEWMQRYDLGLSDIYKHADFNSVTRANCPGKYWDKVMGMMKGEAPAPAPNPLLPEWPGKPAWLDADLIPLLFPEADPNGKRTRAWFAYMTYARVAPARKAFVHKGTDRELILFEGGLMIDREGRQVGNP